jgi:hypothetical protein
VALLQRRNIIALGGAILAVVLTPTAALAASAPAVTVRVEGVKRTLLAPTVVHSGNGWITKGGTPKGSCSTATAAGALDAATRHNWTGSWDTSFGALLLTGIFGETHSLKSKDYWSVWVDGKYAQSGICGLKLHRGEQLLFAAVPDSYKTTNGPLVVIAPATATTARPFTVTVDYTTAAGKLKPLAQARLSGGGVTATTNRQGKATIVAHRAGTLTLNAAKTGYIRAEARVRVS